jgi:hypothetical protein
VFGPDDRRRAVAAIDADLHTLLVRRDGDALGVGSDGNAFAQQDVLDRFRHVRVFTADQPRRLLHDGHVCAESPVHLRELEADIAAADDHEMCRQPVERQNRRVGEIRHLADAREIRDDRAAADVDEDPRRRQQLVADPHRVWRLEAGVALEHAATGHATEPLLHAGAGIGRDRIGTALHPGHVHTDCPV